MGCYVVSFLAYRPFLQYNPLFLQQNPRTKKELIMDRNVEKQEHETVFMDAHEFKSLNIADLDVQELERRLELAVAAPPTAVPTEEDLKADCHIEW